MSSLKMWSEMQLNYHKVKKKKGFLGRKIAYTSHVSYSVGEICMFWEKKKILPTFKSKSKSLNSIFENTSFWKGKNCLLSL